MGPFKKSLLVSLTLLISVQASAAQKEIIFAISPMASPVSTLSNYNEFINYLSEKIGTKVILKQRRTYAEINSLLETGKAQFSFTCTGAFLNGRAKFGLELLAIPVINGKTTYNSYIIVNKKSKIRNFKDLKDKVFAFTDPLSLSGRLYPLSLLNKMGTTPERYFKKFFYTSSHEKSIESVAYNLADAAAVDSLIFEDMKRAGGPAIARVAIIKISPPFGIPPVVVSPHTDKATRQLMLDVLLKMSDDMDGKKVLERLQIERFVLPDPAIYSGAEELRQSVLP